MTRTKEMNGDQTSDFQNVADEEWINEKKGNKIAQSERKN